MRVRVKVSTSSKEKVICPATKPPPSGRTMKVSPLMIVGVSSVSWISRLTGSRLSANYLAGARKW